jgi:hypothetical protein
LQQVVDGVATIGDLTPVLTNTGGWASEPALTIANDVISELINERFPWKWNQIKLPPFVLIPLQQDYVSIKLKTLGWLTSGLRIDINNSQVPPPSWPLIVVRSLPMDNVMAGWPGMACWEQNDQLEQGVWPGPGYTYATPVGLTTPAVNSKPTNILDASGNILTLTRDGTTGATPPDAGPAAAPGTLVTDGSAQWAACDPSGQGIRVYPRTPQGGMAWVVRLWGQLKAPVITDITLPLNPIPDDQIKFFRDGFVAYAHRYSTTPSVKARFETMKANWLAAMAAACKGANREDENKGFYPDQALAAATYVQDQGPYPYRWGWR